MLGKYDELGYNNWDPSAIYTDVYMDLVMHGRCKMSETNAFVYTFQQEKTDLFMLEGSDYI